MDDRMEERQLASAEFLRAYCMMKKLEEEEGAEEQDAFAGDGDNVPEATLEPYDVSLAEGQIRLLSGTERITYVLLLKRWGAGAFLVMPFSRYSDPATDEELKSTFDGGLNLRVLQLWNVRTLQRATLRRSWLIGEVSEASLQEAYDAWRANLQGAELPAEVAGRTGVPIWKGDDPRLDYKREELQNFAAVDAQDMARAEEDGGFWLQRPAEEEPALALAAGAQLEDINAEFVAEGGKACFAFTYSRKEQTLFCVVYDAQGERTTEYDGCRLVDGVDGKTLGSVSNGRCRVVEYCLGDAGNCIVLEDAKGDELAGEWRKESDDGK